jgi:hypothetical protein
LDDLKKIENLVEENKNLFKQNPNWDNTYRRSPNILIAKLIEFTAKNNPSFRLSQIFSYYGIELKDLDFSKEPKEIWDSIQECDNFKKISDDFILFIQK